MKIIYDVMGGDNAPLEIIKGAIKSKNELNIDVVLVGDSVRITEIFDELNVCCIKVLIIFQHYMFFQNN